MSAECIGQKLRTESSDSVAILLGAAGWSIGSALLLVAPDVWVVLATLAAGVTVQLTSVVILGISNDPCHNAFLYT